MYLTFTLLIWTWCTWTLHAETCLHSQDRHAFTARICISALARINIAHWEGTKKKKVWLAHLAQISEMFHRSAPFACLQPSEWCGAVVATAPWRRDKSRPAAPRSLSVLNQMEPSSRWLRGNGTCFGPRHQSENKLHLLSVAHQKNPLSMELSSIMLSRIFQTFKYNSPPDKKNLSHNRKIKTIKVI